MGRLRDMLGSAPVADVKAYVAVLDECSEHCTSPGYQCGCQGIAAVDARARLPEAIAREVDRGMHR